MILPMLWNYSYILIEVSIKALDGKKLTKTTLIAFENVSESLMSKQDLFDMKDDFSHNIVKDKKNMLKFETRIRCYQLCGYKQ